MSRFLVTYKNILTDRKYCFTYMVACVCVCVFFRLYLYLWCYDIGLFQNIRSRCNKDNEVVDT